MEQFINKVICDDCLVAMKDIPDKSIDMVLTSPPYDNLRDYKGYTFNFEGIAKELFRIVKDGGVVVWVVGDATIKGSETGTSFKQALYFKDIGFNLHDTMIWTKLGGGAVGSNLCYTQNFEYMFVFSKGKPKSINLIRDLENGSFGKGSGVYHGRRKKDGTIKIETRKAPLEFSKRNNHWYIPPQKGEHPAVFPEKLAEDHILSWSNEGDIILDPMAGSGTTLKMAKKNNRNYIGIEISTEYIDIINKRLTQDTNPKE
ncbi:MAG: site-specific DNA-methyltransferase [Clostridiales bacterium]|nr:site-specific DNA-methyltransferase [Clostridiales bacterium]